MATATVPRAADLPAALERLPVPAVIIDRDETISWINPAARAVVGDVVGRRYTIMVAPESEHVVKRAFAQKVIGGVDATQYDAVFRTADGARLPVEISSVPLEEGGMAVGVFGLFAPEPVAAPLRPLIQNLTPRQAEVLGHLARGSTTAQIAADLGVSVDTVRNHVRDLLKRLGVHTRLGAVVVARERSLL